MQPIRRKRHLAVRPDAALGRYPGFSFTSSLFYEQSVIVGFSSSMFPCNQVGQSLDGDADAFACAVLVYERHLGPFRRKDNFATPRPRNERT